VVVEKGSGVSEERILTKSRPSGGKVSVEVALVDDRITTVVFKLLPEGGGFQAIWNAKPVVILSKPAPARSGDDIGFTAVEIMRDGVMTSYELN
jgi:hypothetical protein